MDVSEFNTLPAADAAAIVRACADIDSWVETVVEDRPYPDLPTLLAHAEGRTSGWSGREVEAALADHPRIGERHPGGASSAMSAKEQSGVDHTDADLAARLADGNRRYEETFDRIYLVRAAGRSAEEMLDLLEQRLTHDPETELKVTSEQLAEIALLRLEGALS